MVAGHPVPIPPEHPCVRAGVVPPHAVHGEQAQAVPGVVKLRAAPGVYVHRVVPFGDLPVILPGGAHRADEIQLGRVLVYGQHPGDAALGQHLINDVRLAVPLLGQGGFQVVEHHRHRPFARQVFLTGQAGEGMVEGGRGGGSGGGLRGVGGGGRLRGGRGWGGLIPAAPGGQHKQQGEKQTGDTLHGRSLLWTWDGNPLHYNNCVEVCKWIIGGTRLLPFRRRFAIIPAWPRRRGRIGPV